MGAERPAGCALGEETSRNIRSTAAVRIPLAVPLLHTDECGWNKGTRANPSPWSSFRSLSLQLGGSCCSTRLSTTLLWYHAWYHGMSRTGGRSRHPSRILPAGCSETCFMPTISTCIVHMSTPCSQPLHGTMRCYKATYQSASRVMPPLCQRYWQGRHTSQEQTGGGWAVSPPPCAHAARRPGMPRGRRHSQVLYSHAGVCVHAAMCLALALGRRCGLADVCLCQYCVRFSLPPASSKLS